MSSPPMGTARVLLHAWVEWEEGALNRLNGMFALAIWHDERRELVCARDPFGEKPLCWSQEKDRFVFGSSVHCLFEALPGLGAPRSEALATFLGLGSMPPLAESFFAGIHVLPGAHLLRVNDGRVLISRYWSPSPRPWCRCAMRMPSISCASLLEDSVRLRLRSDVPVGSSLSGGVDSSAIVSIAGRLDPKPGGTLSPRAFPVSHAMNAGSRRLPLDPPVSASTTSSSRRPQTGSTTRSRSSNDKRSRSGRRASTPSSGSCALRRTPTSRSCSTVRVPTSSLAATTGQTGGRFARRVFAPRRSGSSRELTESLSSTRSVPAGPLGASRAGIAGVGSGTYATESVLALVAEAAPPPLDVSGFRNPLARELLRQTLQSSLPDLLRYAIAARWPSAARSASRSLTVASPSSPCRCRRTSCIETASRKPCCGTRCVTSYRRTNSSTCRDKIGFETPQARWLENRAWTARIRELLFDPRARERGLYRTDEIESDIRSGRWRDPNGIWRAVILELWLSASFARSRQQPREAASDRCGSIFLSAVSRGWKPLALDGTSSPQARALGDDRRHGSVRLACERRRVRGDSCLGTSGRCRPSAGSPRRGEPPAPGVRSVERPPGRVLTSVIVPDALVVSWLPAALATVRRLVRAGDVDCLVNEQPPESTHLIGLLLGRRRPAWVAEFRDGWRFEPLRESFPTAAQRSFDGWLEQRVANAAEVVVGGHSTDRRRCWLPVTCERRMGVERIRPSQPRRGYAGSGTGRRRAIDRLHRDVADSRVRPRTPRSRPCAARSRPDRSAPRRRRGSLTRQDVQALRPPRCS